MDPSTAGVLVPLCVCVVLIATGSTLMLALGRTHRSARHIAYGVSCAALVVEPLAFIGQTAFWHHLTQITGGAILAGVICEMGLASIVFGMINETRDDPRGSVAP